MVQVKDIRVGNYLRIDGVIVKVDERTIFDFNHDKRIKEGVELTQDLLPKCGFTSYLDGEYSLSNGFFSMWFRFYKNGNISVMINGKPKKYVKGEKMFINSLHQLQNLYLELCHEELEVNL